MALQQITEGITGEQAADIIYANDLENQTVAQDAANKADIASSDVGKLTAAVFAKGTLTIEPGFVTAGAGAIRKTGSIDATATDYNRTTTTGNNMFIFDPNKIFFYTGNVDNDTYAGVVYQDINHVFLGYGCGGVGNYTRQQLINVPANTHYIASCAKGANPVIESQTIEDNIAQLKAEVTAIREDLYMYEGQTGTFTIGALRKTGSTDDSATLYKRTSVSNSSSMFKVQPGKNHFYTGKIGNDTYAGVGFYTATFAFISAACGAIQTYNREPISIPANAVYIAACSLGGDPVIEVLEPKTGTSSTLFVDQSYAGSNSDGSQTAPFKTINDAILVAKDSPSCQIVVRAGDYREALATDAFRNGVYKIGRLVGERVRVLGSEKITGWVLSSGRTNTYQTTYAGAILTGSRYGALLFEDGTPSKPILNKERHPLQKGLSFRLPFTAITPVDSVDLVESTPASYFRDGSTLYLHTANSVSPTTVSIENTIKPFNTPKASKTTDLCSLELSGIQFIYGTEGFRGIGFSHIFRDSVSCIVSFGAGAFRDDTGTLTISHNDEGAFCNGDGLNGHFSSWAGYPDLTDQRSMSPTCIYFDAWCHDNFDDGCSHHEQHFVCIRGILTEWNGDGGVRASNDSSYLVYNGYARQNGHTTEGASGGEGFSVVNPPANPVRNGCKMICFYCISEDNTTGYAAISDASNVLELIGCIGRNNGKELYASLGTVISRNTLATNADPTKIKVTANGGSIEILNDTLVV